MLTLACLALALTPPTSPQATVRTTITFEPASERGAPVWDVRCEGRDLPMGFELELENWGEWSVVDALYIDWISCEPALLVDPPRGETHGLEEHTGELSLHYRLHPARIGSEVQQRLSLLPCWSPSYSFGFAANSLVELVLDGQPIEAERVIELLAPRDIEIVSGFGGSSRKRQLTELDAPLGNALIAFGTPAFRAEGERQGVDLEVVQFGQGFDATESVHDTVLNVLPAIQRTTGRPAKNPVRILITDNYGGGTGTDHGLRVGYTKDTPEWQRDTPYFHTHVTHELFHEWLGIHLIPADDSLVWFFEGFTDYCALWHVAATGTVSRDWFAERLGEHLHDARERSALGRVAFAQEGISWRDGDGPNETLAYKGGALLAFALDVELFSQGKGRVTDLIADLCARDTRTYSLEDIRTWLEERELAGFYARHFASPDLPPLTEDLVRIGFEPEPDSGAYTSTSTDDFFAVPH